MTDSMPKSISLRDKLSKPASDLLIHYTKAAKPELVRAHKLHQQIVLLYFLRKAANASLNSQTIKSILVEPKTILDQHKLARKELARWVIESDPQLGELRASRVTISVNEVLESMLRRGIYSVADEDADSLGKDARRMATTKTVTPLSKDEAARKTIEARTAELYKEAEANAVKLLSKKDFKEFPQLNLLPQIFLSLELVSNTELDLLLTVRAANRTLKALSGKGNKIAEIEAKIAGDQLGPTAFTPQTPIPTRQSAAYKLIVAIRDQVELLQAALKLLPQEDAKPKDLSRLITHCAKVVLFAASHAANNMEQKEQEHQSIVTIGDQIERLLASRSQVKAFAKHLDRALIPEHDEKKLKPTFYKDLEKLQILARRGMVKQIESNRQERIGPHTEALDKKRKKIQIGITIKNIPPVIKTLHSTLISLFDEGKKEMTKGITRQARHMNTIGTLFVRASNALEELASELEKVAKRKLGKQA